MEIGLFEAKARLSELLRLVQTGTAVTITVRGKAVADLLPHRHAEPGNAADELAEFMQARLDIGRGLDLKALIEEGRA